MTDHQLGTTCDRCGIRHRVVESMPNRPFAAEDIARLHRSFPFVGVVGATIESTATTGEGDDGTERRLESNEPTETASTNTLVVSTTRATRLLRRADDHGWVVDREREHTASDDPYTVGVSLFAEAAPDVRLSPADARAVLALEDRAER